MVLLDFVALFAGAVLAQRSTNTSLCDYYASSLYGSNTNVTQFRLVQSIVTMAFAGPFSITNNVAPELTGIWNNGTFQNQPVYLRPWFDGTIDSTNLNNAPVAINWLDGGLQPLQDYLTGATPDVLLSNTSNQFRLFHQWFLAFGHLFGCSQNFTLPPIPGNPGPLSIAYVHKYMNLNHTNIGHFINQFSLSAQHFGFSEQDAETFATNLNSQYNVACAPPITLNPQKGPQLLSLCQASNCPLAEPSPDCAAYVDIGPTGISNATGVASTAVPTPFVPSTVSSALANTSAAPSQSQLPSTSSPALSAGAIAGIAIGSTGVAFLGIGILVFLLRWRRPSSVAGGGTAGAPGAAAVQGVPAMANQEAQAQSNIDLLAELLVPELDENHPVNGAGTRA